MHVFLDKNKRKVLLLHIPKCAGTTLGHMLQDLPDHTWYNMNDGYYNDHIPIKVAKNLISYDYSMCFVRNPYDRFLSKYAYLVDYDYHKGYDGLSIDHFIEHQPNHKHSGCWTPEGWRLQTEYINNEIDHVFKIEDRNPTDVLNEILGTSIIQEKVNTTQHKYKLTSQQKLKVHNIYKEDFKELDYDNLY
jgi:hypothetical protein